MISVYIAKTIYFAIIVILYYTRTWYYVIGVSQVSLYGRASGLLQMLSRLSTNENNDTSR